MGRRYRRLPELVSSDQGVTSREVAFRLYYTWDDDRGTVYTTHVARVATRELALKEWERISTGSLKLPNMKLDHIQETIAHVWRGRIDRKLWEIIHADGFDDEWLKKNHQRQEKP